MGNVVIVSESEPLNNVQMDKNTECVLTVSKLPRFSISPKKKLLRLTKYLRWSVSQSFRDWEAPTNKKKVQSSYHNNKFMKYGE